ncbi:MAG: hypothetical protein WAW37_17045 [Syntrophobacteraceae bacterium]
MSFRTCGTVLGLFIFCLCFSLLAGCETMRPLEFSAEWTSKEGHKSKEQLQADQIECRQHAMTLSTPPISGSGGAGGAGWGGGWGMSENKEFESCLRSKGWVKK